MLSFLWACMVLSVKAAIGGILWSLVGLGIILAIALIHITWNFCVLKIKLKRMSKEE